MLRRGPAVRYMELGLLGTAGNSREFGLSDCVLGPPVYDRGNLVLLERVCSPIPFILVQIDDERA